MWDPSVSDRSPFLSSSSGAFHRRTSFSFFHRFESAAQSPYFLVSSRLRAIKTGPLCYSASNPSLLSRFGRLVELQHVPPPPYPPPQARRRPRPPRALVLTWGEFALFLATSRCLQFVERWSVRPFHRTPASSGQVRPWRRRRGYCSRRRSLFPSPRSDLGRPF
jgi:hypothetical protein